MLVRVPDDTKTYLSESDREKVRECDGVKGRRERERKMKGSQFPRWSKENLSLFD